MKFKPHLSGTSEFKAMKSKAFNTFIDDKALGLSFQCRASENHMRQVYCAEAEILKLMSEWKKHFGLQSLYWGRKYFQMPSCNV